MVATQAGFQQFLPIAELVASSITPIIVAILGVRLHHITKRFDHRQWRNQKLIEKRLDIYDSLAPLLNDNLCYFTYIGRWKDFSPVDIIQAKRVIDQKIYLAAPLFSPKFLEVCLAFQDLCYETYTGTGGDARLKTDFEKRSLYSFKPWNDSWKSCFSLDVSDPLAIQEAYQDVMACFSDEIGINSERE
jgi:hypothetical protein